MATDPPVRPRVGQPGPGLRWFGLDGVEHTGGPLTDFGAEARGQLRLLDSDGNGLADRAIASGDNGVTGYVDTDGDGRWDVKLTDTDGDGAADAASALAPKTVDPRWRRRPGTVTAHERPTSRPLTR